MGFLSRSLERKADPLAIWAEMLRAGRSSKAGPTINLESALRVATLFACLKVLSQGVAQVPFKLFRVTERDGLPNIVPARDHQLYDLVATQPNDWSTSFEFRETLTIHAALGNAYAFKNKVGGKIVELILINPGRVKVRQNDDYSIVYEVTGKSGSVQTFPAEAIWHVRGPSWSGFDGMEILSIAREALGLSIATEETHAKLHAKGVRPSGVYSVEGKLVEAQYKLLKSWIDNELGGSDNAGGVLLLDNAAKFMPTAMTGLDAEHLATRDHQIVEVCRFMGVMPIMVGHNDKSSTFASADAFFEAHVKYTLSPWYARIEQSADVHLLTKRDRAAGLYFKFMAAGLLRGSTATRADVNSKALGAGGSPAWMTVDEVRALEELNPLGGAAGVLPVATNVPKPPPPTP